MTGRMMISRADLRAAKEKYMTHRDLHAMPVQRIAELFRVGDNTVYAWRREYRKAHGMIVPRRPALIPAAPRQWIDRRPPFSMRVRDTGRLLNAWRRPSGMAEHVEALRVAQQTQ